VYIKRVQSFESAPIILEEIWLPGALFKGLTAERLAEYKGPMYGLFETEFGTQMIHATEKLKAALADDAVAATLGVPTGTPVLSVERVAFTYGERPVELRRAIYVTAQHHYHNELS
jgi:GntR family transcriptional regulator